MSKKSRNSILLNICLIIGTLSICSCDYYQMRSILNNDDNTNKVVLANEEVNKIIARINSECDKDLYVAFEDSKYNDKTSQKNKSKDDFNYGLEIAEYKPYTHYSKMSCMEISKFTIGEWKEVSFVGFSTDSMYMVYQLGSDYYVKYLYSKSKDTGRKRVRTDFAYECSSKQEAIESVGDIVEVYNYDTKKDESLKKNNINLRVSEYAGEEKNGFYISIYDVKNKKYERLIYSKKLSKKAKPLGKVKRFDLYFTPDKSWAVVHPYFDNCNYDYGFFLVNIRREYSEILKIQAIDNYKLKKHEEALTKYRQCIQLYPAAAEIYYDCATLMKMLGLPNYSKFAEKAVKLKPKKYSDRAYKDGLIKK